MHESLERIIDRSRQRQFTDEEISGIACHANRLAMGCEVLEQLRPLELDLVESVVTKTAEAMPGMESNQPGITDLLRQSMLTLLRQSAFAMAVDDNSRLCDVLCDLQAPFWQSHLDSAVIEYAMTTLRDDVATRLGGSSGKAFDTWLHEGTRFFILSAEIGQKKNAIIDAAVTELFNRFPDLETRYDDCRQKTVQDFELILQHSVRGVLPDGEHRVFRMLRIFHEAIVRASFGAAFMEEALEILTDRCRENLHPGRSVELFAQLHGVTDFVTLSADLGDHLVAIIDTSVDRLAKLYPDQMASEEIVEKAKRDQRLILEHCAYATHPAGQDEFMTMMSNFYGTLTRFNFGSSFIADAYKMLLETCRTTLRARSRSTLLPILHRASHFIGIAADLAEHRGPLLTKIADQLESTFGPYYAAHPHAKALTIRDQDQLLASLSMCLLPGGENVAAGRFASFGESILLHNFDPQLMSSSFDLLEKSCMEVLSSHALALLIPHWHRVRQYLDVCVALASNEATIIDEAAQLVYTHFAADVDRFSDGRAKTAQDLRTLLRTAALTAAPGGASHLVRGLSSFMAHLADAPMSQGMLDTSVGGLIQAVDQRLPEPHRDWLLPVLQQCHAHVHVTVALSTSLDQAIEQTVDAVFSTHTQKTSEFPGARRKSAEDFAKVVRQSTTAFLSGGGSHLAWRLWAFSESIFANRFGADFFAHAYSELRQKLSDQLAAETMQILAPTLDQTIAAVTLMAELAERADSILGACSDMLYQKYPDHLQKFRASREKTHRDMQLILRASAISMIPGSEGVFAHVLQRLSEVLFDGRFGGQFMWDAYDSLARGVETHIQHASKQALTDILGTARDYIALMAELAEKEDTILNESMQALYDKYQGQMQTYRNAREATLYDQRILLRSCALALLPGGQSQHQEIIELMRAVTQHSKLNQDMLLEGYALLQQNCSKHLKIGSVEQLAQRIDHSVRLFAA